MPGYTRHYRHIMCAEGVLFIIFAFKSIYNSRDTHPSHHCRTNLLISSVVFVLNIIYWEVESVFMFVRCRTWFDLFSEFGRGRQADKNWNICGVRHIQAMLLAFTCRQPVPLWPMFWTSSSRSFKIDNHSWVPRPSRCPLAFSLRPLVPIFLRDRQGLPTIFLPCPFLPASDVH